MGFYLLTSSSCTLLTTNWDSLVSLSLEHFEKLKSMIKVPIETSIPLQKSILFHSQLNKDYILSFSYSWAGNQSSCFWHFFFGTIGKHSATITKRRGKIRCTSQAFASKLKLPNSTGADEKLKICNLTYIYSMNLLDKLKTNLKSLNQDDLICICIEPFWPDISST